MSTDPASWARELGTLVIPLLFAITVHEVAHGLAARYFGDRTAERLGRLTLNPLKHVDPLGTVLVPLLMYVAGGFVFGWARPVPVNVRELRDPVRNMIVVAAAGPAANFLMAFAWVLLFRVMESSTPVVGGVRELLLQMCAKGLYFNVLLGVFNLLPIPPLDGGRILRGLVSESAGRQLDAVERYGLIIVVALLATGILDRIIGPLFGAVQDAVLLLAGLKGRGG